MSGHDGGGGGGGHGGYQPVKAEPTPVKATLVEPPRQQPHVPHPSQQPQGYHGPMGHSVIAGQPVVAVVPPNQHQTVLVVQQNLRWPMQVVCPRCQNVVVTEVTHEPGILTYLSCLGLAMFGCVWGCCLMPFCIRDCQSAVHSCPVCRQVVTIS